MAYSILITGGSGYVGTVLTQRLLDHGYRVKVLDTFWFGDFLPPHDNLTKIRGDIRNHHLLEQALYDVDAVIHMACLSNDPTSDLDPELTEAINYSASKDLIRLARGNGVGRFIYSSSTSVYGVREEEQITEDMSLEPTTLYSRYKAEIENELFSVRKPGFTTVAVRNSTVCGYSPRMRLDTVLNLFVVKALREGVITVEGGQQRRPLICMDDLLDFYELLLEVESEKIDQQAFNVSTENFKVIDIAKMVQRRIPCELRFMGWTDPRSYHVNTEKVFRVLGYKPKKPITYAIDEVKEAYTEGLINAGDSRCYNIRHLTYLMRNGHEKEIRCGMGL